MITPISFTRRRLPGSKSLLILAESHGDAARLDPAVLEFVAAYGPSRTTRTSSGSWCLRRSSSASAIEASPCSSGRFHTA